MRYLFLLRHAKSNHSFNLDDYDRPLSNKGTNEAIVMARFISEYSIKLDKCLYSSAKRTSETADAVKSQNKDITFQESKKLYLSTAGEILKEIGKEKGNILVIAHNPGIHNLAKLYSANSNYKEIEINYPTASLTIIETNNDFNDLENSKILKFITPNELING